MTTWWLSFTDPERDRFLGVAIVRTEPEADEFSDAIRSAWRSECNPGGQVSGWPLFDHVGAAIPDAYRNRVLTSAEATELEGIVEKHLEGTPS